MYPNDFRKNMKNLEAIVYYFFQLFSALNQKDLALKDFNEAIKILPSAQLYTYRGSELFNMKVFNYI